jgi:predicted alpha/beta-fold hydrolase
MRRTEEPDEREPAAGHAGRASQEGATVLLSVHGLAGCHRSTYVQRLAWHAIRRGWYSYRMDMRGAGSSGLQSRFLYHAGRSDDVLSVLRFIRRQHPTGRIFLCGFSLGGSIALHLLANLNRETRGLLDGAVVVCPPLDLGACAENIRRGFNRIYDQTFARALWKSLQMRPNAVHQLGARMPAARPKSLVDFDHLVTAPLGGYESADHYYRLFSTDQQVHRIDVPTLALFAKDDPLIPYAIAERTTWSDSTRVVATDYGGHLGFIGGCDRGPKFPTVRWLEHAVIHAIEAHLEATPLPAAPR